MCKCVSFVASASNTLALINVPGEPPPGKVWFGMGFVDGKPHWILVDKPSQINVSYLFRPK